MMYLKAVVKEQCGNSRAHAEYVVFQFDIPSLYCVVGMASRYIGRRTFFVPVAGWEVHRYIILKSVIVLSSWILGYFGMKNLPITIVGPINATRPVMVLVGALLVFGERLNLYQWIGVLMAVFSFLC